MQTRSSFVSASRAGILPTALGLLSALALPAQPGPAPGAGGASPKAGAEVIKLEAFTVTGSNIKRMEFEKVLPVTVISFEAIQARNPTTPVEMLQALPQITGSSTNEYGPSAISGRGDAASLNLRGIGDSNTLILLDGMRMPPRPIIQGQSLPTNVNALPSRGLERIDVLRDGASSIYGSDATAGVVNFVTKRDFQGTEVILRGGFTQHGGAETGETVVTNGLSFAQGRGNLLSAWSFLYRNALYFRDRSFTRSDDRSALAPAPWNTPSGPFNTRSAVGFWPTFFVGSGTVNTYFRPVAGTPAITTVAPNRHQTQAWGKLEARFVDDGAGIRQQGLSRAAAPGTLSGTDHREHRQYRGPLPQPGDE